MARVATFIFIHTRFRIIFHTYEIYKRLLARVATLIISNSDGVFVGAFVGAYDRHEFHVIPFLMLGFGLIFLFCFLMLGFVGRRSAAMASP